MLLAKAIVTCSPHKNREKRNKLPGACNSVPFVLFAALNLEDVF